MFRNRLLRLAIATAVIGPGVARADAVVLDYPTTIKLAAERAPAVIAARGRIGEARGQRAGAGVRPNPELEVNAGPRLIDGDRSTDLEVGLAQTFELGGRRDARIGLADAEIAIASADAADAVRLAIRDAGLAYYRALAAEHRLRLATEVASTAATIADATDRRVTKGDALELDANLARSALGRARAAVHAAEADREASLGELRVQLALDAADAITLRGDLATRRSVDPDALTAAAHARPDLEQLAAEERAGTAERALGDGFRWPDLGLGVSYGREENAQIILGGIRLTLPVFDRGQGHRAAGRARTARASAEKRALARHIDAQLAAAVAAYRKRLEAVDEYEQAVNPLLAATEDTLRKGYEAGQLALTEYLIARREILDARAEYVQRLLEAAEASVEVDVAAGVMP